jgi:hypothetical protein
MAPCGRVWSETTALQGFLYFYYGRIWLTAVCALWFTRERSKVRSLVRPPFKAPQCRGFCIFGPDLVRQLPAVIGRTKQQQVEKSRDFVRATFRD